MLNKSNPKQERETAGKSLATIAGKPRLPYRGEYLGRYDVDEAKWRALVDAVFPQAKTLDAVLLALDYCKAKQFDPLSRAVHIVPIWDSERGEEVETIWPGIVQVRTIAARTGEYGGNDACEFGPDETRTWKREYNRREYETTVTFPSWARLTVYRVVQGVRCAFPGPRVKWLETYGRVKGGVPNSMWRQRPEGQLEKCAEAAALRRAFPEALGGEYIAEEADRVREDDRVEGYQGAENARDITPQDQGEELAEDPPARDPDEKKPAASSSGASSSASKGDQDQKRQANPTPTEYAERVEELQEEEDQAEREFRRRVGDPDPDQGAQAAPKTTEKQETAPRASRTPQNRRGRQDGQSGGTGSKSTPAPASAPAARPDDWTPDHVLLPRNYTRTEAERWIDAIGDRLRWCSSVDELRDLKLKNQTAWASLIGREYPGAIKLQERLEERLDLIANPPVEEAPQA